jgi:NADPH:quinone reductase-like Zn-dependent oxidoreductase
VGGSVFDASARVLAPMGRLVTIGSSSGVAPERLKLPMLWPRSISVCGLHIGRLLERTPEVIDAAWSRVLPLLAERVVNPGVGLVIAPADISAGMDALTSRAVSGRIVMDFTLGTFATSDTSAQPELSEGVEERQDR